MHYKTIVHELLLQRPQMQEHLRKEHKLLTALEFYAQELKDSHEAWKELLTPLRPGNNPDQISSEAMELAVKELEDRLPAASHQSDNEAFSLDAAIAYLRKHMSPG